MRYQNDSSENGLYRYENDNDDRGATTAVRCRVRDRPG